MRKDSIDILGEDQRQVSFARRVLEQLSFDPRKFRKQPVPDGGGCGRQFVNSRYAELVRENRQKRSSARRTLVISIDADNQSIRHRKRELDERLTAAYMDVREPTEPVVVWVPKRNIETWILHLTGENVDESQDYKLQVRERTKLKVASERFVAEFHAWKQDPTNISSLPSLIDAYTEIQRIL